MKKLSRFLAVLLAAALLLSCSSAFAADFSAPSKVKDIADLPEMPDAPTMKTKNNGVTETVTLSDELSWLCAVWNWKWVHIDLDGTTATYDIAENNKKYKCQQGMGTWESTWTKRFPVDGDYTSIPSLYIYDTTTDEEIADWFEHADAALDAVDPGIEYEKTTRVVKQEAPNVTLANGTKRVDRHTAGYKVYDFYPAEENEEGFLGTMVAYWTCDKWEEGFGTYELRMYRGYGNNKNGNGFLGAEVAFDGATKDGVRVKYNRKGVNTARSIKSDDANVFGTEIAPVSTEFVWILMDGKYYLSNVIATYEEGDYTTIEAWYGSNGSLRQVHASK